MIRKNFLLLATVVAFAMGTTAMADQLVPVGGGTAKGGGHFVSYVDKDSVESGNNGMMRFIIVNRFEKPQQIPKDHKGFSTALQEVIANCKSKMLVNPKVAFLDANKKLVERADTGETTLGAAPANAKIMLEPAMDMACKIAQNSTTSAPKTKS